MDNLRDKLGQNGCLGVVRTRDGRLVEFHQRGVADLFELLEREPDALNGASVVDKVVGRGAALLLVKGKVSHVYAQLVSSGARDVLQRNGVSLEFDEETPFIRNLKGDAQCPVERLTATVNDPDEAFKLIKEFIGKMRMA